MGILFALMSALTYGTADFAAGLASRAYDARPVTGFAQALGMLTAAAAVLLFPGAGPKPSPLEWGALSGVGSALGTLALYRGLALARMSVVATLSGVLTAVIPVLVGIALGNHLRFAVVVGIVIAVPAIALVSWHPGGDDDSGARAGVAAGCLAGLAFALLFVALDRAGTRSGAWPLVPGQLVSVALTAPVAYRGFRSARAPSRAALALTLAAGVLSATANLLFLAATGHGQLAIVAVLTALYPAVTVICARVLLSEQWGTLQATGLLIAALAIVLVTAG
jgi:drug/metabolite transporter (DMT)-like permease